MPILIINPAIANNFISNQRPPSATRSSIGQTGAQPATAGGIVGIGAKPNDPLGKGFNFNIQGTTGTVNGIFNFYSTC